MNKMSLLSSTQQTQTVTLASVLAAPLASRCELLVRLLADSSVKDLMALYPLLLEDIFGFGGRPGWNLQLVTRKCHPREFDQLRTLLQPTGSVFSVIYRLIGEPHMTFEFPTACLPFSAGGGGPSTLSAGQTSLLSQQTVGGPAAAGGSVLLNPFELYLHHFCYFLLNPAQQAAQIVWTSPGDALYPTLLEDLMTFFLPCGPHWVPPLNTPTAHHHHPPISLTPGPRHVSTPPRLLLRSPLLRLAAPAAAAGTSPGHGHFSPETWRSEALLRTAAAFWLEMGPRGADGRTPAPAQSDFFSPKSILDEFGASIPSYDHVRVVRMLVKHMHFFMNSPHHPTGLDEFKRQAQAMIQRKLYGFLRHTFKHWPTDTSFRLVLETWLSYIQPWRYVDFANKNRSPGQGQKEVDKTVEPVWARFVAENLLFYSAIFRQLLPRFHRMDLTVPRYAYMVYRLAKVMCQPGLVELIREAEGLLGESKWHSMPAAPAEASLLYAASVGQHILDLEESGFTYQSMFDATCRQQVQLLICRLSEARAAVQMTLNSLPPASGGTGSLWSSLLSALVDRSAELTCGEYSPEETLRGASHLESALQQLAKLFELPVPERPSDSPSTPAGQRAVAGLAATPLGAGVLTPSALQSPAASRCGRPETVATPDGPRLTARGRRQLISGLCRADVQYRGDPERRPPQSRECAPLLRLLQAVSAHINSTYGSTLAALYARNDFAGYLAHQLIQPPATFYHFVRTESGLSTRQPVHRPASVSLRPLADYRCLVLLAGGLLLGLAAGLSLPAALLALLLVPAAAVVGLAAAQLAADRWRAVAEPAETERTAAEISSRL